MKGLDEAMQYNTLLFVAFLMFVILLYYTVPVMYQNKILLAFNIFFYLLFGIDKFIFLFLSTAIVFFAGCKIDKIQQEELYRLAKTTDKAEHKIIKIKSKKESRTILIYTLIIIFAFLIYSKYLKFLINNLNILLKWFDTTINLNSIHIIGAVGISFYTFMLVGYILDVYWKRYPAEKNFITFFTFTSYFPHIVQGPIGRYNRLNLQFCEKHTFNYECLISGIQLMLWGFFKKLVIADRINLLVTTVYDGWTNYEGLTFTVATVLYSIQIYADFSGCIDIVRGASETLGIQLDKNFNHPYFSKTMPEFWRRWHMSLNEWFKDYLYYPVSISGFTKKYSKKIKEKYGQSAGRLFVSVFSAFIVWLATGIWHGAEWKFIAWGLFHAILIISGLIWDKKIKEITGKLKINIQCFSWHLFQTLRTFFLCCIGRVFFRAENIKVSFEILRKTISTFNPWVLVDGSLFTYGLDQWNFILMVITIVVLFIVDMLQEKMSLRQSLAQQNIIFRWTIIYLGIFSIIVFGIYGEGYNASAFIYNQF